MNRASGQAFATAVARLAITSCVGIVLACYAGACREADPLKRVKALQAEGHWEESAEVLRGLVDQDGSNSRLHLEYGKALMALGDATRAIWPLRRAAEADALAEEAGVLLSMALLASSNPEDAIVAASKVIARDSENPRALFARSRALLAAKREEEALVDADLLVELMPDDPQARLLQLGLLVMHDKIHEAEEAIADAVPLFEKLASTRPEEGARFCVLDALFVWEKGDPKGGETRLDDCLTRYPDQPLAVREAADQFDRVGQPDRATSILRSALERDPKQAEFRLILATRLREQGDPKAALELLTEGTSILEGPGPWLALHDHYVSVEDYGQARKAMERALALQTDPASALRIAYADDLILSGDLAAAEREAAKIPAPGIHLVRGRILLEKGDAAAAVAELEEGIRLWPDNPSARWLAGQAAEQAGDFPRAISHYRESVRTDAARTPAARELAEIYAAMGAGADALDFAMRNLDAQPQDPEAALLVIRLSRRFEKPNGRALGLAALASMPDQQDQALAQQALERALVENDAAGIAWLSQAAGTFGLDRLECLRAMTELELRAKRSKSAEQRISNLLREKPDSVELLLLLADVKTASDSPADRAQVRALLERARQAAPADARVAIRLARLEAESGQIDAAVAMYEGIPAAASEQADAVFEALELRRSEASTAGKLADASIEQRLGALLAHGPRNVRVALALGRLLAARDSHSERALALVRNAVLLGGGAPAAATLGQLLVERGDFESAVLVLEKAIASFPESGPAQYWLGRAHEGLGHAAAARQAFEHATDGDELSERQRAHATRALARRVAIEHRDGGTR